MIIQNGDYIYLTGQGASAEGDRPFLDQLDLKTLKTERLFRSDCECYESVIAPLSDDLKTVAHALRDSKRSTELLRPRLEYSTPSGP